MYFVGSHFGTCRGNVLQGNGKRETGRGNYHMFKSFWDHTGHHHPHLQTFIKCESSDNIITPHMLKFIKG